MNAMKRLICILVLIGCCNINSQAATINIVGPSAPGVIIKGPATKTIIKGPDGSVISSVADAGALTSAGYRTGAIVTQQSPAGVVHATNHHVPIQHLSSLLPLIPHRTHYQTHQAVPIIYAVPLHYYRPGINTIKTIIPGRYHQVQ